MRVWQKRLNANIRMEESIMSLQKDYFRKCPKCGKKGIHVDKDTGGARCKYCMVTFKWSEIK